MKTLEQFLSDYLGQSKGYPEGKFVGECLSICKLYIKECFGIDPPPSGTNSAYGYWSNFPNPLCEVFEKIENTDDLIPEYGWIAIWKPWSTNQYGHIAIVDKGCTKYILKDIAQNWSGKNFQRITQDYTNVIGYLKPKNVIIDDMTDIVSELIKTNGITEGDIRWLIDLKVNQTVSNLEKQIEELKEKSHEYEVEIQTLLAEITEYQKEIKNWQSNNDSANKQIQTLEGDLQTMTEDRNKFKGYYENALKDQVNKYSAIELIKLGLQKLFIKK